MTKIDPELIPRRENYETASGEQEFFTTQLLRRVIDGVLNDTKLWPATARVLDVGAGECPLRNGLVASGHSYASLDVVQNKTGTIDFVAGIDGVLPRELESRQFDGIVCTEVLEHVADWNSAFRNLNTLLVDGGICVITAPFLYMPHEEPHDFWRPTDFALRWYAGKYGFIVESAERIGGGWEALGTVFLSTAVCRRDKNLLSYFLAFPVWLAHRIVKMLLKTRVLEQLCELQTRFYLGNIMILRKTSVSRPADF
jgi:SAM-dependent methyltransferase